MERLILVSAIVLIAASSEAQVTVRENPSPGFEKRIREYVGSVPVVDTHEHLLSIEELRKRGALDFMILLTHYSADDLKSAGMTDATFRLLIRDSLSVSGKWKILKPFWEASSNTAYNRIALLAADKIYNIKDINESTVVPLSEKISSSYRSASWISDILDRANVAYVVQMNPGRTIKDNRFRDVIWFDNFIGINSRERIATIARQRKVTIKTLDDLMNTLEETFKSAREQGVIAVKSALAYSRTLLYENVSSGRAIDIFDRIMTGESDKALPFETVKPLQDYIMHMILDLCRDHKVPFIFHTGLQSGNGNQISNSNPALLANLFREYPGVDFILLHGGYPYGGEMSAMVKYFRNVYMDIAWIYAISPSFSERYLHEWLETVPVSKIMGFGGDYFTVENLYAHLLFARQVIANVLTAKVRDGYFSESEAKAVAKKVLYDNAIDIYNINP